jgi:hypothetical protein
MMMMMNATDDDQTAYFYNDTINTGKIKISCVYNGVIKMYFNRILTYHFKNTQREPFFENPFSRKYICTININHNNKQLYYSYADEVKQDFESIPDFLQACINERSKEKIIIKMGALYGTVYSKYCVIQLSDHLYGRFDYCILNESYIDSM